MPSIDWHNEFPVLMPGANGNPGLPIVGMGTIEPPEKIPVAVKLQTQGQGIGWQYPEFKGPEIV